MTWALVDNPVYAGRAAAPLEAACHDRTPFVEVACTCGERQHYHESQLEHVPPASGIEGRCSGCGELLRFPPGLFANAFAEMRRRGWLAPRAVVS